MFGLEIIKTLATTVKINVNIACWSVPVFFYHKAGDILAVGFGIIIIFSVNKHHYVGVLFNGPGLPQIGQLWYLRMTVFHRATQLGKSDDRNVKFAG